MTNKHAPHAGQAIVDSLESHGVERVFAVPGESYLSVLDGLYASSIDVVVCRHEGGASYMAEAHGKFTGSLGVAMVTRGPGAANAFVAVHAAWQDATPMVLFVGLIPIADRWRESFQEFDPHAWFGTQAKKVMVLDEPSRASEIVAEAFFTARTGRPGPVIIGLPEDVILENFAGKMHNPLPIPEGAIDLTQLSELKQRLRESERPMIFAGGPRWTPEATADLTNFAERNSIPVMHDWRAADKVPFSSPANAGWLGYGRDDRSAKAFQEADLLIAVGAVPTDVPTDGYTLRQDDAVNIIVNADPALLGRSGPIEYQILASPVAFSQAVKDLDIGRTQQWESWCKQNNEVHRELADVGTSETWKTSREGTAHMSAVMSELVERIPKNSVYTFGAGNHCFWAQRFLPTEVFPSQLSMRNGSMGYSIPAAVSASLQAPERLAIAIAGDGEFLMNGQELATAQQHGAPILGIVMDNGQFATIREHQESHFPGRVSGTHLENPDFATFAQAFGAHGEVVTDDSHAAGAVERALEAVTEKRRSAIIHVIVDPDITTP